MSVYKGNKRIDFTVKPGGSLVVPSHYQLIRTWRWQRSGGPSIQTEYRGNFPDLYKKAHQIQPDFDSLEIQKISGDMYLLSAAQAGDEITEIFDVQGSSLSQSVMINPIIKARMLAESGGVIIDDEDAIGTGGGYGYSQVVAEIRAAVNKFLNGTDHDYDQMVADVQQACGSVPAPAAAMELMDLLARGTNHFMNAQYTFSHTINIAERIFLASSDYFAGAYENTCRIFTEAQLRLDWFAGGESIPAEFPMPTKTTTTEPAEYLKLYAGCNIVTGQKRSIVSQYQSADRISRALYAEAEL